MMKIALIITGILVIGFGVVQYLSARSTKQTELHKYTVVEKYDDFEIRQYNAANFISVKLNTANYSIESSNGFRTLAGYIFGGNEEHKRISMTSPVSMELQDSMTMKFMVPSHLSLSELPTPNNKAIQFSSEPVKKVAAITFGGWANDTKIENYTNALKELLEENGIEHNNQFKFLGYNPPYEVMNRRNEIIVELEV